MNHLLATWDVRKFIKKNISQKDKWTYYKERIEDFERTLYHISVHYLFVSLPFNAINPPSNFGEYLSTNGFWFSVWTGTCFLGGMFKKFTYLLLDEELLKKVKVLEMRGKLRNEELAEKFSYLPYLARADIHALARIAIREGEQG
ncbi:MAG: hypothetical protein D6769_00735 [Methanobacteriota archaeon]|nr:MAG: hypothetical protein D6769_00735 [Euryarchaeota archaeon]